MKKVAASFNMTVISPNYSSMTNSKKVYLQENTHVPKIEEYKQIFKEINFKQVHKAVQ
jgi:hypothetical protein